MKESTAIKHILLVEDDHGIARLLAEPLRDEGYFVDHVPDGESGLQRLNSQSYDLLLLDLILPGIDGLEICRRLRATSDYTPIIIVSSKSAEVQRVVGLEMGADDYIAKPFSALELVARVRALLRRVDALKRTTPASEQTVIVTAGLRLDTQARSIHLHGRPVSLTVREFDLLHFFVRHPNRTFTRLELLNQVWGYSHDGYEHTVNSHINRLRAKIECDPTNPKRILTVWGIGYKFAPQDETVQ